MRVIAMFRVSTERQADEGASLDAQERIFHEMAADRGWVTLRTFRGAESATLAATERRVLQEVLACIDGESPDALYVHEQSRLTRGDELEVARLLRSLRERHVKIIVGGVVRDMSSIDERFMVGIQSLVDRAEAERIKERVSRGKRERARQGKKNCGPAPLGYRNPPIGHPDRGILQVVEEEARIVRRIFDLAGKGVSSRIIADTLDRESVAAPKGGRWGKTSVIRILKNPAYLGMHVTNGWVAERGSRTFRWDPHNDRAIVVRDAHAPIVSQEQWDLVHGRPKAPRTRRPRMLTGLLWVNGEPTSGDVHNRTAFYRGPRGSVGLPWLAASYADQVIWEAFASIGTDAGVLRRLVEQAGKRDRAAAVDADLRRSEEGLSKLRRRLEALIDMRADGELDKLAFAERSLQTQEAIRNAELRIKELRSAKAAVDPDRLKSAVSAVRTLIAANQRLTQQQRRVLLRSMVVRIDAAAERTWLGQHRGIGGRLSSAKTRAWTLREVTFHLGTSPQAPADPAIRTRGLDTTS